MDCWERLGMEPSQDVRQIKRAYARQTAMCHPEEHPEEFRVLHAAYQQALHLARQTAPQAMQIKKEALSPERSSGEDVFDFDALIRQHQERQKSPVFEKIAIYLQNPKQRNNRKFWREFFMGDAFLRAYSGPEFISQLTLFFRELPDNQNLPRQICVWLHILSGLQYYRDINSVQGMERTAEIRQLLLCQQDRYISSELHKKENEELRCCYAMLLRLLEYLQQPQQPINLEVWASIVHPHPAISGWNVVRSPVFTHLLGFSIRCLPIPQAVYPVILREYHMDGHSANRELLAPLHRALEPVATAVTSQAEEQKQREKMARDVYFAYYNLYQEKGFRRKETPNLAAALEEFQSFLDSPDFAGVMLSEKLLEKLQDFYRMEGRIEAGSHAAMELLFRHYQPYRDNPKVSPLLVMLQEKFQIYEARQLLPPVDYDDTERLRRFNPERTFAVESLNKAYSDFQQQLTRWSVPLAPRQKRIVALFSMLRTLEQLDGCHPKPKYGRVDYFRDMGGRIIKHYFQLKQGERDMHFGFYRQYPRSFYDFLYNEGLLQDPRYRHMDWLLKAWYAFCDFEFLGASNFEADMVHGFILCPVALRLQELEQTPLLPAEDGKIGQELAHIQQDCLFLLEKENGYEQYMERAQQYGRESCC